MNKKYFKEKTNIVEKLLLFGVPKEQAEIFADCLVTADEWGVESHGQRILSAHLDRIKNGGYNLKPTFKIIKKTSAFAVINGDNALGPVSADFCMRLAIDEAKTVGIYHVFSNNNNTLGPAFYYPLKAAEQGLIGLVFCNSPAQMAPIGGKEKLLGTNPFAAVIPVPESNPIIIDMATSVVAKSKFKQYKEAGLKLPDGWALDENGNPTNDPDEGMKGLVLPMAGFKGYSIAMLIDILSGLLSGAAFLKNVGRFYSLEKKPMNVGFCCIAIDPKVVLGDCYETLIREYVEMIRTSKSIGNNSISLPGDDRIAFKESNS